MDITLEETERLLTEAIANKGRVYGSGNPDEKAAADETYRNAHKTHWDLYNRLQLSAPGAQDTDTAEMRALDAQVSETIMKAHPQVLFLHNDHLPASVAADRMFRYFASTGEMYRRGSSVVELDEDKRMVTLNSTAFRSRLNKRGRKVMAFKVAQHGELYAADKHCGEDVANVLLHTSEVTLLPEIKLVVRMPVLIEVDGILTVTAPGYNPGCGVLVTSDTAVPQVTVEHAVAYLRNLLRDFRFSHGGDESRSLAALIGPALRMGGFYPASNALVDVVEANESQTGKGTRLQVTHAIYGESPYPVAQKDGGVGSLDESIAQALLSGAPFITLDNLRGNINSTYLEHAITPVDPSGRVSVRVPHSRETQVDVRRTLFQATSNGFSSTIDLANRFLITRLLKQPPGYQFAVWAEGGLLQHIKHYAAFYLGCVHAVVRYWHAMGKPKLPTVHSFKDWVGSLDWIVQNVFGAAPLLDGHASAAERIANPSLTWLRQLAFAVLREGKDGQELRAGDIREVCERHSIMPDGVKPSWEENHAERAIGKTLGTCFPPVGDGTEPGRTDSIELEGIIITRTIHMRKEKETNYTLRPVKLYTFRKAA